MPIRAAGWSAISYAEQVPRFQFFLEGSGPQSAPFCAKQASLFVDFRRIHDSRYKIKHHSNFQFLYSIHQQKSIILIIFVGGLTPMYRHWKCLLQKAERRISCILEHLRFSVPTKMSGLRMTRKGEAGAVRLMFL